MAIDSGDLGSSSGDLGSSCFEGRAIDIYSTTYIYIYNSPLCMYEYMYVYFYIT